jgi:hypothetical protein
VHSDWEGTEKGLENMGEVVASHRGGGGDGGGGDGGGGLKGAHTMTFGSVLSDPSHIQPISNIASITGRYILPLVVIQNCHTSVYCATQFCSSGGSYRRF